jgi:VanZ family protein
MRHRSMAAPLALAYAALVLYASLYPFVGWRWPPGQSLGSLLVLPWPRWDDAFDRAANLIGYVPLGALLMIAARRSGIGWRGASALALLLPLALSYGTEVLQQLLPRRVPSLKDFVANGSGAAIGALFAAAAHRLGHVDRWHALRERWFVRDSAGALALLALWPLALLFPSPVPLGLGQIGPQLSEWLAALLAGVPWAEPAHALLTAPPAEARPLSALADVTITAAGLLAPCLLAFNIVLSPWRRVAMAFGAAACAAAGMTISTGLNFGPAHATAWAGPHTPLALGLGVALACALAPLPRRLLAGIGLVVLTGLVAAVAQAPADPYFALSLQAWEQGRFVRFHGAAQWLGWAWPYAAMLWLLSRLATGDRRRDGGLRGGT